MMGVYINMDMPKSCGYCPFENHTDDGYECRINGCLTEYQKRPSDCPLIPVPPHGRLIDADALDEAFTELRWDDNGLAHWGDRKDWCLHGSEIGALISAAPTIILASEEGE